MLFSSKTRCFSVALLSFSTTHFVSSSFELTKAADAELRSTTPDTPLWNATLITVDQSDDGAVTQALLKFDLSGIVSVNHALLRLLTISPTTGTVRGYRMLKSWSAEGATWHTVGNGIEPDNYRAQSLASFAIHAPQRGAPVTVDVTADVEAWLDGEANYGWLLDNDSTDGFDFTSAQSWYPPALILDLAPTAQPTPMPTEAYSLVFTTASDSELRSDIPNTPLNSAPTITVDLSDGGGVTQAVLKFDLNDISSVITQAVLKLFTVSRTSGTVRAYRMIEHWDASTVTWQYFGENGIEPDGIVAQSNPSFEISHPSSFEMLSIDVTADVLLWLSGVRNEGWVFITDAGDGWDFTSANSAKNQPTLILRSYESLPEPDPAGPSHCHDVVLGVDTEIRDNLADTPLGSHPSITVDLSDGGITQGLLKFDLRNVRIVKSATLNLFTVSSTSGNISAYRMIQSWDQCSSTWDSFKGDFGVQPDGVMAYSKISFQLVAPQSGTLASVDVTADVKSWVSGDASDNQGWVFRTDSKDGWDFLSFESPWGRPTLTICETSCCGKGSASNDATVIIGVVCACASLISLILVVLVYRVIRRKGWHFFFCEIPYAMLPTVVRDRNSNTLLELGGIETSVKHPLHSSSD